MNALQRAVLAAPLLVACALYAAVTGAQGLGLFIGLILASSVVRPLQISLSAPGQALLLMGSGLLAVVLNLVAPAGGGLALAPLKPVYLILSIGGLLLAAARGHLANPVYGAAGTLACGLAVLLGCGGGTSGPLYMQLVIAYVALAFFALRFCDAQRTPWLSLGWRHQVSIVLILLFASGLASGLMAGLPKLYEKVNEVAFRWFMNDMDSSGFHDGPISLSSLHGMLQSNEIVMRIYGPVGDHLRGNVYTRYHDGSWSTPSQPNRTTVIAPGPLGEGASEIHMASAEFERFFLPTGAAKIGLDPPNGTANVFGIVFAPPDRRPQRAWLQPGKAERFEVAPPSKQDLQVPERLREPLEGLVQEWVGDEKSPEEILSIIKQTLEEDYTYSLDYIREGAKDPLLQFLLEDPQGHCEYFASATALLSRSAGIPARMVTGFIVMERSPPLFMGSGYQIVRQRHAHAWVEAYLPERGWVTIDPSPLQSFESGFSDETPLFAAIRDLIVVNWKRWGPTALLIVLIAAFAWIQLRQLRGLRKKRRASAGIELEGPPAFLEALLECLATLGIPRRAGETLEAFARRLRRFETTPDPNPNRRALLQASPSPADLLLDCAAYRYGEIGSANHLEQEVQTWLEQSRRA